MISLGIFQIFTKPTLLQLQVLCSHMMSSESLDLAKRRSYEESVLSRFKELSDLTLICETDGVGFKVHKSILSAESPVFSKCINRSIPVLRREDVSNKFITHSM